MNRFTALLPVLPMLAHLDLERGVHLHMAEPFHVDRLLRNEAELREAVRLIMASERIVVWFAQERVWDTKQTATVTPNEAIAS